MEAAVRGTSASRKGQRQKCPRKPKPTIVTERDLYHNPNPIACLVGPKNETIVTFEGKEEKALKRQARVPRNLIPRKKKRKVKGRRIEKKKKVQTKRKNVRMNSGRMIVIVILLGMCHLKIKRLKRC